MRQLELSVFCVHFSIVAVSLALLTRHFVPYGYSDTLSPLISIREFLRQRPDNLLFHYTDATGLIGIVQTQQLWATNALHLNDSSGFVDAMERLIEHTNRQMNASTVFAQHWGELHEEWETKGKRIADNIFVVSFSTEGNQLSQWRAYCPEGNGYSLGFNLEDLAYAEKYRASFEPGTHPTVFLVRCIYDAEMQNDLIRALVRYMEFAWKRAKSASKRYFALSRISRRVIATLLAIKHSSFSEEREWRLVCVFDEPPVFFRSGRFGVTPFVKIPLCEKSAKMTLEKIWIGPNLEPDAAGTALDQL